MISGGAGISRYVTELSVSILSQDKRNQYVLFFNKLDDKTREVFAAFGHKMIETGIGHYSWQEQLKLPAILNREALDLIHFPHFNVPLLYRRPFVVTIHDLTHTRFPGRKKSRVLHRLAYNLVLKNAINRSRKIIAVSESTKKEILENFRVPEGRIEVVYEGAAGSYGMIDKEQAFTQVSNRFGIRKPYILYVGVWRRYKNLPRLAQAYDRLAEAGRDFDLVLAGEPDPFYPEIKEQVYAVRHKDRIRAVGRVTDQELNLLYNAAAMFVLPSLYEGFGLTALEAAACGIPIVCSDIPALREVMGAGADYFDAENIENMADVMLRVLDDPKRAEELANLALGRIRHFSWKQAGLATINFYEEALK